MSQQPPFPPPPGPPPGMPPGQPPAGPPPFPPPGMPPGVPGPPPPGGGQGKGLWIALGVVGVVLLVGVVIGLIVALTGDDDSDGEDRGGDTAAGAPEDVVEKLVDAAEDGDCAAAERLLTEEAKAAEPCEDEAFQLLATEDVESDVHDASIDGSTASVPADFTSQYGSSTYTFLLEKVDGEWLVASYDVSRSSESDDPSTHGTDAPTASVTVPTDTARPSATGSSSADAVPDEPAAVVEAFLDSAFAGDCATAEDLVTTTYLDDEGSCDAAQIPTELGDSVKWKVGDATVDDAAGTATVPVEITIYGSTQKSDFELAREGGRWKISDAG